ncbi:MAG: O-antigen ligase family protein [Clostridia bacterium]|nr:O-antigen ligase family protein [Clostridia bacterium]
MSIKKEEHGNNLLLLLLLFGFSMGSIIITGRTRLYTYVIKLLTFMTMPICLAVYREMRCPKMLRNWIYFLYIGLSGVYMYAANLSTAYDMVDYYGYEYISKELVMGFANPNAAGMTLMICAGVIFSAMLSVKNRLFKVLLLADFCQLCWLIWLTKSRACILAFSIVLILYIIGRNKRKISRRTIMFFMLVPFIYWFLTFSGLSIFESAQFMGEDLGTGRNAIYMDYMGQRELSGFLIGNFMSFRFKNMHNGYITVLATIGIAGFIPFFLFLRSSFNAFADRYDLTKSQFFAAYLILGVMAHQAVESALLSSGLVYGSGFALLYLLSLPDKENPDPEDNPELVAVSQRKDTF